MLPLVNGRRQQDWDNIAGGSAPHPDSLTERHADRSYGEASPLPTRRRSGILDRVWRRGESRALATEYELPPRRTDQMAARFGVPDRLRSM